MLLTTNLIVFIQLLLKVFKFLNTVVSKNLTPLIQNSLYLIFNIAMSTGLFKIALSYCISLTRCVKLYNTLYVLVEKYLAAFSSIFL